MKLAIMQPYFFPYLGYFDLIHSADLFIVYDTVQYIREGWIHRNRVLHPDRKGWRYIIVPTEAMPLHTPISAIRTVQTTDWQARILRQLGHYGDTAPHAARTMDMVSAALSVDEPSISRLNVSILARCARTLGIDFHHRFCSELGLVLDPEHNAEQRVLDICEFLGATEYLNLPGGVALYHPEAFAARNVRLSFRDLPVFTYDTGPYRFEPNLSIIDLLMWNTPEAIKNHLDRHRG